MLIFKDYIKCKDYIKMTYNAINTGLGFKSVHKEKSHTAIFILDPS